MIEAVFVLHGAGNRGRETAFGHLVAGLAEATGLPMKPVYWGDLGAVEADVQSVIPTFRDRAGFRGETPPADGTRGGALAERAIDQVVEGMQARLGDAADPGTVRAVVAQIEAFWPEALALPEISDPVVLAEVGATLAEILLDFSDEAGLREFNPAIFRRWLTRCDRMVGATRTAVLGGVNESLRSRLVPGAARFVGDVLVYQRHRETIQQRVRNEIRAAGVGTERTPVRVLAHSLGGVIAMDLATDDDPLWIRDLVTFGSQWPLFHLVDPRGGQLAPHEGHAPAVLPPSLGAWTNAWEPLDPLAFVAATRYVLHDGRRPRDAMVPHLERWGVWTHSSYWHSRAFAGLVRSVLGPGEDDGKEER
ncbi:hypothetical protein [Amycolatopsis sp. Hca4]|uniref:hypothetical protein n=1 Tax=Amycolatopsis sp. Hca4 TaxID=2742131 RepID=UPI00158FD235|nr:hypothetical protein [Amycolatopsis sp. Hca4]QKV74884.1 hypothetical protein HUT10_14725 [Amycolatopsis sp. Hca4]